MEKCEEKQRGMHYIMRHEPELIPKMKKLLEIPENADLKPKAEVIQALDRIDAE